jgi:hypothetical protein
MSTDTIPDIYQKPGVPYSTSADLYSTTQIGAALPTVEVDSVVNYPLGGGEPETDPLVITFDAGNPIANQSLVVGTPYSLATASHWNGGPPPISYTVFSGTLPGGVTLNSSTGVISGTPTTPGSGAVVIRGTDDDGNTADSNSVTFTVVAALAFSGPIPDQSNVEDTAITPLNISGYWSGGATPLVYSVFSGTLPVGLSLDSSTGIISGTPTTPN